ncbi:putative two-component system sensor kinase [Actinoplanes missouriensis 431]|uniref:histidine kinase n=1 Tax=Actinoplanes missouriensis (strain ATCC 14538 / DSM 43046 / CBS 188.64 / JCM 3121 / NBRC 102363 / NCIMB 12654 / NRRL B-3342 / UNCC 431) TaxID=512565 RepID=I0H6K7_ACTM4|nr:histidine kinase [Actinoplanes missouriensis]BAL88644.1 putative two-component system sensor kinase [Actinoplanes missouriensis 431]
MELPAVLTAARRRRFLISAWPWRALGFVLSTVPLALIVAAPLGLLAAPWIILVRQLATGAAEPVGALLLFLAGGVLLSGLGPLVAWPLGAVERLRLRLADDRPLTPSRSRWRRFGYALVLVTAVPASYAALVVAVLLIGVCAFSPLLVESGPISFGVVTVVTAGQAVPYAIGGLIGLCGVPHLLAVTAGAHAAVARAVLRADGGAELRAELVEVSRSRARLADAFEAERRRIERDLHDGAQQKLVGLTLQLGLARLDLPDRSPAAAAVGTAHEQAKELMAELRELIHGIRPQLLTELGLPAALRDLARQSATPVRVRADLGRRLSPQVEATAYFVVAEALANVAKHSGAGSATVSLMEANGLLAVEVVDDGSGGADPARGTGLTGLADRAAAADGRLLLSSPPGGPTVIRLELPC